MLTPTVTEISRCSAHRLPASRVPRPVPTTRPAQPAGSRPLTSVVVTVLV